MEDDCERKDVKSDDLIKKNINESVKEDGVDESEYNDIIDLPHHVSNRRRPMTMKARAAQFAPFSALNGHEEAIQETAQKHIEER